MSETYFSDSIIEYAVLSIFGPAYVNLILIFER